MRPPRNGSPKVRPLPQWLGVSPLAFLDPVTARLGAGRRHVVGRRVGWGVLTLGRESGPLVWTPASFPLCAAVLEVRVGAAGGRRVQAAGPRGGMRGRRPPLGLAAPPPPPHRAPPTTRPASSLPQAPSCCPQEAGRAGVGPAPQPLSRPRARGNPGPAASRVRRGGAARCRLAACAPSRGPGSGSGAPRARAHGGQSAEAVPSACNERSPGEPPGASEELRCCVQGCCCRCGCLKLLKVESRREAAARREPEGKEVGRCKSDGHGQTDAQTFGRHRVGSLPGAREAPQLRKLFYGWVVAKYFRLIVCRLRLRIVVFVGGS